MTIYPSFELNGDDDDGDDDNGDDGDDDDSWAKWQRKI